LLTPAFTRRRLDNPPMSHHDFIGTADNKLVVDRQQRASRV
jgi:hypothetical protein